MNKGVIKKRKLTFDVVFLVNRRFLSVKKIFKQFYSVIYITTMENKNRYICYTYIQQSLY